MTYITESLRMIKMFDTSLNDRKCKTDRGHFCPAPEKSPEMTAVIFALCQGKGRKSAVCKYRVKITTGEPPETHNSYISYYLLQFAPSMGANCSIHLLPCSEPFAPIFGANCSHIRSKLLPYSEQAKHN